MNAYRLEANYFITSTGQGMASRMSWRSCARRSFEMTEDLKPPMMTRSALRFFCSATMVLCTEPLSCTDSSCTPWSFAIL